MKKIIVSLMILATTSAFADVLSTSFNTRGNATNSSDTSVLRAEGAAAGEIAAYVANATPQVKSVIKKLREEALKSYSAEEVARMTDDEIMNLSSK